MPELRKDPIIGRWVIISTGRGKRPSNFTHKREDILKAASAHSVPVMRIRRRQRFFPTEATVQSQIRQTGLFGLFRINSRRSRLKAIFTGKASAYLTR